MFTFLGMNKININMQLLFSHFSKNTTAFFCTPKYMILQYYFSAKKYLLQRNSYPRNVFVLYNT